MIPTLPGPDSKPSRKDQLEKSRETYQYAYDWPEGVATAATLPKKDDYSLPYMVKLAEVYAKLGVNVLASTIHGFDGREAAVVIKEQVQDGGEEQLKKHIFTTPIEIAKSMPRRWPKSWTEYESFFELWERPPVVDFFHGDQHKLDRAFAWQRVAGVNPMVLARCDRVPDHLGVTEERYARAMAGDTMAAAAAEGRLYLADYAALDGVECGVTDGVPKYLAAPMALFAVAKGGRELVPVAIQLGQTPDHATFGPADGWRWRMAETLVQIADANVHEGVAHLGRTHMVMEAVALATKRCLADAHPLYLLLEAHLEGTLAINNSAKTSLIAPGGVVDRCFSPKIESFCTVVKKALDTYPIARATPENDLAARGLLELPEHPYRDDVRLVWRAVEAFAGEYVDVYYGEDAQVAGDAELQAFVAELGAKDGGRLVEVPGVATVPELKALITKLVFIAGPGHSAVNFPQFPYMGFVPNMPGASYRPVPAADTPDDEAEYTKILPPYDIALQDVTTIYVLSEVRTSKLGDYRALWFLDPRVAPVIKRFQRALEEVEQTIVARDATRLISYPYLRPSQILQSISI